MLLVVGVGVGVGVEVEVEVGYGKVWKRLGLMLDEKYIMNLF